MKQNEITVYLVEDDCDFAFLVEKTLEKESDLQFLGSCAEADLVMKRVLNEQPDIVLVDLCLDGKYLEGIEIARNIRIKTDAKVIILTAYEDINTINKACTRSFASDYLFKKNFSMLTERIRACARGVTSNEMLIFSLILSNLTPSEQSQFYKILGMDVELSSSPKTQANQKLQLLKKLKLSDSKDICHLFKNIPLNNLLNP